MEYRPLGETGLRVSVLGLGCAQLGASKIDLAADIARRAVELGINYFDVASNYDDAETKLGIALEGIRERVILSTKIHALTRDDAWRELNLSLERLRTDHVDNLHLHALERGADLDVRLGPGGAIEALQRARDEGLTRHIGGSAHQSATLLAALERFPFEIILIPMNIVEREPLDALIPLCQARGVGITVMKPLATGILPPQLALRWLATQPIATAVAGTTTLAELEENVAAMEQEPGLSAEELADIEAVRRRFDPERCRICQQCEPCPQGIPIAMTLGTDCVWDHLRNMGAEAFHAFPWGRAAMEIDLPRRTELIARIEACDDCGYCEQHCPHHLPIRERLRAMLPGDYQITALWAKLLSEGR